MVTPVLKEQILEQIETLSADKLAEVARFIEFLQFRARIEPAPQKVKVSEVRAFGIWADYVAAQDPVSFAQKLRQMTESRQDADALQAG